MIWYQVGMTVIKLGKEYLPKMDKIAYVYCIAGKLCEVQFLQRDLDNFSAQK